MSAVALAKFQFAYQHPIRVIYVILRLLPRRRIATAVSAFKKKTIWHLRKMFLQTIALISFVFFAGIEKTFGACDGTAVYSIVF